MPRARYSEDVPILDDESTSDSDSDSLFDNEADSGADTDLDSLLAEEDSDNEEDLFDDEVVKIVAVEKDLDFTKRPSATMYAEDLAEFARLAGITGNRLEALVELQYRHLKLTLIRDPDRGSRPRLFIKLTPKFTKGFLGSKDMNEFKIPEIIYDLTLVLSPHVFLLGLLFKARAFKSPSINCLERLYSLKVLKGLNKQLLPLRDEINDEFIFYKAGVYRRLDTQKDLMRFTYSMSRSIDPRRPRKLTPEQTALVNGLLYILKLHKRVNDLSKAPVSSRKDNRLQKAIKRLYNEKQRKRRELLKDIKERYKSEQPMKDSERQLSGIVVDEDTRDALVRADMSLEQLSLIDAILTLPRKSPEQEL
ncbi:hypothetical protein BKA61DRAFT_666735 [Leptodontidium sp. MPI-SDFR-AT-0119]|nr:hypothetical protein BKA61DRAFT_666735 [Leptodontidium sp. MPI-SDFR-AT-0119]